MKKQRKKSSVVALLLFTLLLLLGACKGGQYAHAPLTTDEVNRQDFLFDTRLKYAKKYIVEHMAEYKVVTMLHPLQDDTLATYILALHDTELPEEVEQKGDVIRVPISSIVSLSSSHVGALERLGLTDFLIGATSTARYWDEKVQERIREGKILEVGRGMSSNVEQIISLQPDVVTKNDHGEMMSQESLRELGISMVYYNDWRENDLLGRAEWLKVMGLLFCQSRRADSLFNEVEERYLAVKALAQQAKSRPRVLVAQDYRGVWFLPGNTSYVPSMIEDANGSLKTVEGKSTSVPVSFERAYTNHHDDDIWLSMKAGTFKTLQEFERSSEHYTKFKAFQTGNVYFNNKRVKPTGGNDFWESGGCSPDVILKDLVKILHPELLPDYEMYYWRKLD